jgi:protein phosphatase
MRLHSDGASDVGCVRTNNEDAIYRGRLTTGDYLFVVADGMGGHHAGEVASRRAVTRLVRAVEEGVSEPIQDALGCLFERINADLFHDNEKNPPGQRMGTTLTALLTRGNQAYVAHVGDSRLYRVRTDLASEGQRDLLTRVTDDHSRVGELVREGALSEAEARVHPKRSVLTQAVGMGEHIKPQVVGPMDVLPGDRFLLCSDGLSSVVTDPEIQECFAVPSSEQTTRKLIRRARAAGGPDNISVIVVSTEPDAASSSDGDTAPEIELPSSPGARVATKRPLLRWFLLGLLILLLAAVAYVLVDSASSIRSRPGGTTAPMSPKGG